jgi:hypothetical protein
MVTAGYPNIPSAPRTLRRKGRIMDKNKLLFFIDALMFLTIMTLAGLGLLIKYVLIPGRMAWAKYGRQMELTWLGLDRHAWGAVHLYLAFLLVGLLVLHVFLHRKMILSLFAGFIADSTLRKGITPAFFLLALALLVFPLLVTPEVNEVGLRENRRLGAPSAAAGLPLTAVPVSREEQAQTDLAPPSGAGVPGAQETPQSKRPRKKIHSSVWPKEAYDQADYRRHPLAPQGQRTTPLLACDQNSTNRPPQGPSPKGLVF